jgi:hypothetical protein
MASETNSHRRARFRRIRIAVLLSGLVVVLLYAWNDVRRRRQRNEWERPLEVGIVLLKQGSVDPAAAAALEHRFPDLERRLAREMHRYRDTPDVPFHFTVYGPVDVDRSPPRAESAEWTALAAQAWESWRYYRDVDSRAAVPSRGFDSRIYIALHPVVSASRKMVEGQSEEGGWVGQVNVELDSSMVDFALFVATHELFHTLGATDAYDALGRAKIPAGLADPLRSPLYPQVAAEVMARNVVIAPGVERAPETLDELVVGRDTAAQIGWTATTATP